MQEDHLLTGPLELTNELYALAKIADLKMCQAYNRQYGTNYICLMPTNLYGPGDDFDTLDSHVIPALLRRFHEAKVASANEVVIWGTGTPRREFLYVDDLAAACVFLMESDHQGEIIDVGVGQDLTIKDLAQTVAAVVGFQGRLVFDPSYPDTPKKLLDITRISQMGWRPRIPLEEGLRKTYEWFCSSPWVK